MTASTPEHPQVSVIIPCRAATRFLPLQLSALRGQREAPHFEVLLCDNGGNSGLEALADDVRVRVVDATQRRGTAFARNCGIRAARAETLMFCDADDVVGPTWVRDGFAALQEVEAFSGGAVPMSSRLHDAELVVTWRLLSERLPAYVQAEQESSDGTYPMSLSRIGRGQHRN